MFTYIKYTRMKILIFSNFQLIVLFFFWANLHSFFSCPWDSLPLDSKFLTTETELHFKIFLSRFLKTEVIFMSSSFESRTTIDEQGER